MKQRISLGFARFAVRTVRYVRTYVELVPVGVPYVRTLQAARRALLGAKGPQKDPCS